MKVTVGNAILELTEGDITKEVVDGIVNAAHWDLRGGQGTDGAIHWRGGREIMAECLKIGACPIGGAVVTTAGKLPARYVIHAVGPVYDPYDTEGEMAELLTSAYQESLRRAVEHGMKTVAFPSLSTGAFCYPLPLAAPIALRALCDFLEMEPHDLELVRLVLYPREQPEAYGIYADALTNLQGVAI